MLLISFYYTKKERKSTTLFLPNLFQFRFFMVEYKIGGIGMKDFTAALLSAIDAAQTECGVRQARLRQNADTYGGVSAAKDYIKRNRASDGFDALKAAKRLDLSMEALVVSPQYHAQFTDEEVNACFALLCGADYY